MKEYEEEGIIQLGYHHSHHFASPDKIKFLKSDHHYLLKIISWIKLTSESTSQLQDHKKSDIVVLLV